MFNIVLHEPEKPDNTGNIGRTCVITGSSLHLIYPIGFRLTRSNVHHAGLDYWERLKLYKHDNYKSFIEYFSSINYDRQNKSTKPTLWFATTKAHQCYNDVKFNDGDFIMFGKESAGIPEEILKDEEKHCIRIPMSKDERSLNLSNSVAIILYEALRQNDFLDLERRGELHHSSFTKHDKL